MCTYLSVADSIVSEMSDFVRHFGDITASFFTGSLHDLEDNLVETITLSCGMAALSAKPYTFIFTHICCYAFMQR